MVPFHTLKVLDRLPNLKVVTAGIVADASITGDWPLKEIAQLFKLSPKANAPSAPVFQALLNMSVCDTPSVKIEPVAKKEPMRRDIAISLANVPSSTIIKKGTLLEGSFDFPDPRKLPSVWLYQELKLAPVTLATSAARVAVAVVVGM